VALNTNKIKNNQINYISYINHAKTEGTSTSTSTKYSMTEVAHDNEKGKSYLPVS